MEKHFQKKFAKLLNLFVKICHLINSLIWTFALKHFRSGENTVEIATQMSTYIFNDRFKPLLNMIIVDLNIVTGTYSDASKRPVRPKKLERSKQKGMLEKEEGLLYGPGIAD
ncbi:hypothetical protein WH47_05901 [Habropoda laboriosa]|uniref:Uncharacterized protein n=1 Tax=Habropoda laboriosa TaxID=597456 RepID=A0A0L7REG5_9HYME|nr:hypothetical protein WH47_05901 [Habropoda laboriosa]